MRILFLFFLVWIACKGVQQEVASTPEKEATTAVGNVGDIAFDAKLDHPDFKICQEHLVKQYYNFSKCVQVEGEKIELETYFKKQYQYPREDTLNGYVTIRFIVNCEGETGRFRVETMNREYELYTFPSTLTQQLLELTRSYQGWKIAQAKNVDWDYYQYLTFKIEKGQLTEILP